MGQPGACVEGFPAISFRVQFYSLGNPESLKAYKFKSFRTEEESQNCALGGDNFIARFTGVSFGACFSKANDNYIFLDNEILMLFELPFFICLRTPFQFQVWFKKCFCNFPLSQLSCWAALVPSTKPIYSLYTKYIRSVLILFTILYFCIDVLEFI